MGKRIAGVHVPYFMGSKLYSDGKKTDKIDMCTAEY